MVKQITGIAKAQRVKWLGHVWRIPKIIVTKRIGGKRKRGPRKDR